MHIATAVKNSYEKKQGSITWAVMPHARFELRKSTALHKKPTSAFRPTADEPLNPVLLVNYSAVHTAKSQKPAVSGCRSGKKTNTHPEGKKSM
jgi:hypothetical protein